MKPLKLSYLVTLIVLSLLLSGISEEKEQSATDNPPSISETKEESNTDKQEAGSQQSQPPTLPSAVIPAEIGPAGTEKEKEHKQEEPQNSRYRRWRHWLVSLMMSSNDLPNWIVIGGWTVVALVAYYTLRAIRRQANLTERIIIELERPWLWINPKTPQGWPFTTGSTRPPAGSPVRLYIEFTVENVGRSPAFFIQQWVDVNAIPIPNRDQPCPQYGEPPAHAEFLIPPGRSHTGHTDVEFAEFRFDRVLTGEEYLVFYGFIRYHDTSREKTHCTRFCSWWTIRNGQLIFVPVGPPDWVKYT